MDKKEITSKQAVSKLTAKFAGYGVFILALYKIIETLLHKTIFNSFGNNQIILYVTLGLFFSVIMLITSHILCRISTHDVLKKYKLKDTDIETVSKKMINVFLCFIAISIVISIIVLYVSIMYESKLQSYEILLATQKYQEHYNVDFLNTIINEILSNFYTYRSNVIAYTFITELGFCVSLIAIAPFQKIMIKKYNS